MGVGYVMKYQRLGPQGVGGVGHVRYMGPQLRLMNK